MSSTGCPSLARNGKPRESIRGSPVGCGHDPVVKVCPQKWNASESPGSISVPTVRAAVRATSAPPTRARKPRREVFRASESVSRSRCSGIDRTTSSRCSRQHALQLHEIVEGSLGEDGAMAIECDGKRTAGDSQIAPQLTFHVLVEDTNRDAWVLCHVLDRRREGLTEVTTLGGEYGKTE